MVYFLPIKGPVLASKYHIADLKSSLYIVFPKALAEPDYSATVCFESPEAQLPGTMKRTILESTYLDVKSTCFPF